MMWFFYACCTCSMRRKTTTLTVLPVYDYEIFTVSKNIFKNVTKFTIIMHRYLGSSKPLSHHLTKVSPARYTTNSGQSQRGKKKSRSRIWILMEFSFIFIKFNYFLNKVKPKTSTKLKFQVCTLDFGIDIGPTFSNFYSKV